jgi:hypothetical protein
VVAAYAFAGERLPRGAFGPQGLVREGRRPFLSGNIDGVSFMLQQHPYKS